MSRRIRPLLPYAEASLVALSVVTALTFWRLFNSIDFLPRLVCFPLASHGIAMLTRRRGWSLPVAAAASIVGAVVVTGIVLFPSATAAGIPTASTVAAIRDGFADLWTQFQEVKAPTPVTVPFLLAAGLGLWWAAFVADWAAFRLWVPFESIVPASTVFIFASLFSAERGRAAAAGLFLAAAIGFLLVHRVTRQQTSAGWVSSDVQRATNSLLRAGAWLGGAAVLVAVILGPSLPEATADGYVDWRNVGDDNTRIVDDPFVDIRSQLLQLSEREVFTVSSDQRAYWRLTALDEFDGERWRANGSYGGAKEHLPTSYQASGAKVTIRQHFTISGLNMVWVPAAFEPRAFDTGDADVQWDKNTSTLIVVRSVQYSDGLAYDVVSELPTPDASVLQNSIEPVPSDIQQHYTELPADFSPNVRALAESITAGKTTPYEKALALQDYLRGPDFSYSLDVSIGEGMSAIEDFLLNKKVGYCQQFAGSFGAMARAVGLPTRIAVGYTPGEQDEKDPNLYHVRGEFAHAWPEVFIGGVGWVQFEPTPGRGAPNTTQYTNVPEQQASPGDPITPGPTSTSLPQTGEGVPGPRAPEEEAAPSGNFSDINLDAPAGNGESWWSQWGRTVLIGLAVVAGLAILYVIAVPSTFAIRRRRRRHQALEPVDQVRVAWTESVESLGTLGLQPADSETATEFANRSRPVLGTDLLHDLVPSLDAAEYSTEGVTEDDAESARTTAATVATMVRQQATRQQRIRAALDPRPPERRHHRPSRQRGRGEGVDAPPIEVVTID